MCSYKHTHNSAVHTDGGWWWTQGYKNWRRNRWEKRALEYAEWYQTGSYEIVGDNLIVHNSYDDGYQTFELNAKNFGFFGKYNKTEPFQKARNQESTEKLDDYLVANYGISLGEIETNLKVEGYSYVMSATVPGILAFKISSGGGKPKIRLRHYTNNKGLKSISKDMKIVAKDQNKVFTTKAKGKAYSAADAESKLGIKRGKGRNYIEFDVDADRVNTKKNERTGALEYIIEGDVNLDENTKFVKRKQ